MTVRRSLAALVVLSAVASAQGVEIRPSAPNTVLQMRSRIAGGRLELGNASVVDLVRLAWNVDADHVVGGPAWIADERFDIDAPATPGLSTKDAKAMGAAVRAILSDRFRLASHTDMRALPAFVLTAEKSTRLTRAAADSDATSGCSYRPAPQRAAYKCKSTTMAALADELPRMVAAEYVYNYPVVDRTGLDGAWDFDLTWPLRRQGATAANADGLFASFESLGLRLRLGIAPQRVVVVERVERPAMLAAAPEPKLAFEVATVKPAPPDTYFGPEVAIRPGGYVTVSMTTKGLIQEAWGDLNPERIVVGKNAGAKNLDDRAWAIEAKAAVRDPNQTGFGGPLWNGVDLHAMRMMLRSLLVERFGLAAHTETRAVRGYALVASKPRLRKAAGSGRPACQDGPGTDAKDPRMSNPMASKLVTCRNVTLAEFADRLSAWSPEETILLGFPPVADATGIAGRFDLTINFTPPQRLRPAGPPGQVVAEPDGSISIFEALDRQLGLKLVSRDVPARVLVVDQIAEAPVEN